MEIDIDTIINNSVNLKTRKMNCHQTDNIQINIKGYYHFLNSYVFLLILLYNRGIF